MAKPRNANSWPICPVARDFSEPGWAASVWTRYCLERGKHAALKDCASCPDRQRLREEEAAMEITLAQRDEDLAGTRAMGEAHARAVCGIQQEDPDANSFHMAVALPYMRRLILAHTTYQANGLLTLGDEPRTRQELIAFLQGVSDAGCEVFPACSLCHPDGTCAGHVKELSPCDDES